MKKKTKEQKDYENGIYHILKTPNFYFPMTDMGKKFRVENTYNLIIKDKAVIKRYHDCEKMKAKTNHLGGMVFLSEYADMFWHVIKEYKLDKKYKDCWLVPLRISEIGNELEVDIDVLRPVSSNKAE